MTLTPLQDAPGVDGGRLRLRGSRRLCCRLRLRHRLLRCAYAAVVLQPRSGRLGRSSARAVEGWRVVQLRQGRAEQHPRPRGPRPGPLQEAAADAAAAVAEAEAAAAAAADGLYVDVSFPADETSLGAEASSLGVVSWRRLGEIEPPDAMPRGGDGSLLAHAEGCGLKVGTLKDEWLLGALNVVGGNVDVLERTFVDTAHAAQGFYAVRLYAEDPASDDDWQVVLIDDRIRVRLTGCPPSEGRARGRAVGGAGGKGGGEALRLVRDAPGRRRRRGNATWPRARHRRKGP